MTHPNKTTQAATSPKQEQDRQRDLAREVVRTVSRGNVNLQLGRYVTEADKERMRQEMREYVIKAPI